MLKRVNQLETQYGGAIPFSALDDKKTKRTKKKSNKKSPHNKKHKKRSISPARIRRKVTKKLKRSKKKTIREKKLGKQCKCGSHKYTGKEETPRGLGKCEECIPLNVVMKGKNGKLYENRKGGWHKLN
jgi:hypothetical protein